MAKEEVKKNNKIEKEKESKEKKTTEKKPNATKKVEKKEDKNTKKKETKKSEQLRIEEIVKEDKEELKETTKKEKQDKKIKTSDIGLIVGLVLVIIIGLFAMKGEKVKPSYTLPLELKGEAGLQLLSYADYQSKIDKKEPFVVVLSRESCGHCANFIPVAKEFAEEKKLPMYYIDTDTFSQEDWSTFETSNTFLKQNKNKWGTPTTVVLVGEEAVDYIEGETTKDNLIDLYNKYFKLDK